MFKRRYYPTPEERAATKARNVAVKAEKSKTLSHCQICDRLIQARTGLIAHHGYQRPGDGWQTASCMGALYRPYEIACDALPPAIESCKGYIKNQKEALARYLASPPAGIEWTKQGFNYDVHGSALRPAGFDPTAPEGSSAYTMNERYGYDRLYRAAVASFRSRIKNSKESLAYLEQRLASWKPSEVKVLTSK